MSENTTISFTGVKETLLITLYAKALDYEEPGSMLHDKKAHEILKAVNYDFGKHQTFGNGLIVVRAAQYDEWVREFLSQNKECIVVYLGCGLDSGVDRINPGPNVHWYDVDYPDVIEVRKQFFKEQPGYTMVSTSITAPGWMQQLPNNKPTLILAEGVLEYLKAEEVKDLLNRLTAHFRNGEIIFDVMSSFAVNSGKKEISKTTGAVHQWAVDDFTEVDRMNPGLQRTETLPLFRSKLIRKLPFTARAMWTGMGLFKTFRNMIVLLKYRF